MFLKRYIFLHRNGPVIAFGFRVELFHVAQHRPGSLRDRDAQRAFLNRIDQELSEFHLFSSSAVRNDTLAKDHHLEAAQGCVLKEESESFLAEMVQGDHFSIDCPPGNSAPHRNINN